MHISSAAKINRVYTISFQAPPKSKYLQTNYQILWPTYKQPENRIEIISVLNIPGCYTCSTNDQNMIYWISIKL